MKKTILTALALLLCTMADAQITTTPEGTLLEGMEYCSKGMVPDYTTGQVARFEQTGVVAHVVNDGRKFYIQDPITHYRKGVWMEGELSDDGTQVVFHTPQVFTTEQGTTYYLYRMAQKGQSLAVDPAATDLIFSYADGTLTQTDGGYLSICNAEGRTTSYVEYGITIRPIGEQTLCPPADARHQTYQMSYESEGAPQSQTVDVALSGSDVFIANPTGAKDSWIHGTLDGDRLTCPNGQFLGADEQMGRYVWLQAAEGSVEIITIPGFGEWPVNNIKLTEAEAVVFAYDTATRSFSCDNLFLVNAGRDALGEQYADFDKVRLVPYNEQPAVPADPQVVSWSGIIEGFGFGLFAINMPAADVDGHYINQDNMYYNVFIDGQQLVTPDGQTDIPYNYTDGQTIRVSGISHTFQSYTDITDRIGVQVFYRVGDVVNSSNLVWYDIATEGIDEAATTSPAVRTDCYDALGRPVAPDAKGLVIRRTTFADGTVRTDKHVVR